MAGSLFLTIAIWTGVALVAGIADGSPSSATVVRASNYTDPVFTDGPFAETKEQLGGFWIIEAPDLDAALAWAAKGSAACMSPVEVRPFQDV